MASRFGATRIQSRFPEVIRQTNISVEETMTRVLLSAPIAAVVLAGSVIGVFAANAGSLAQQTPDQWRASKLSGVSILGPDKKSVGKVSDVLMGRNGKAEYVIIGVGGFLGIGEKDVAVPFDQVRFTDQPLTPPTNPTAAGNNLAVPAANGAPSAGNVATASPNPAPGTAAANGGVAPGTTAGLGTPSNSAGMATAPADASAPAHSTAYPDHGTIDMTADQLKNAPAFHFAS